MKIPPNHWLSIKKRVLNACEEEFGNQFMSLEVGMGIYSCACVGCVGLTFMTIARAAK